MQLSLPHVRMTLTPCGSRTQNCQINEFARLAGAMSSWTAHQAGWLAARRQAVCCERRRVAERARQAHSCRASPSDPTGGGSDSLSGAPRAWVHITSLSPQHVPDSRGCVDADFALLTQRVARLRDAAIAADRDTASNWRIGRAKHQTLCVLDDWCRKLVLVSLQFVVVGTFSGPVHVVDVSTGAVVHTLVGLAGECSALACDGTTVVAGSETGSLACWSLATGLGGRLGAHAGAITALQIVEGGTQVLVSSASGDILAYALTAGADRGRHSRILTADSPVLCLQRQGHYTAAGCIDGRVMVWAGGHGTSPLQLVLSFTASSAPITCLQMLVAADADAADDDDVGEAGGVAGARTSLLITGAGDGSVASWDLAAGGEALLDIGNAHRAPVTTLQADHSKIVTGGRDGVIRCWDAATGTCRFSLAPFTAYLDGLAFRDGLLVATGSNNSVSLHNFGTTPVGPQRPDNE